MAEPYQGFDRLDGAGRALAAVSVRPRGVVYVALVSAIALSWLALGLMAARQAGVEPSGMFGPGAGLVALVPVVPLALRLERFFMLCLTPASLEVGGAVRFAVLALMWLLMSVAMMLPSAVPMIRTYCEIADTAAAKGEKTVHPLVLAGGYLCAWVFAPSYSPRQVSRSDRRLEAWGPDRLASWRVPPRWRSPASISSAASRRPA